MDLRFKPKRAVAPEHMLLIIKSLSNAGDWDSNDPEMDLKVQNGEWKLEVKLFLDYDPASPPQQRLGPLRAVAGGMGKGLRV